MQQQASTGAADPAPSGSVRAWGATLAAGLAAALVAQFLLDSFADSSTLGHWIQHATLFFAGLLTGAALVRLYQLGGRAG